jgi:hypothetical protein
MTITTPRRRRKRRSNFLQILLALAVLGGIIYFLPPVRERVDWRLNTWRMQIMSVIRPPEKEVFVPQKEITPVVTLAVTLAPTLTPTVVPTIASTVVVDQPTAIPTVAPTALPTQVSLKGVRYIDQHGVKNYCAPSTLGMALSYYGWKGTRVDVGKAVKPYDDD